MNLSDFDYKLPKELIAQKPIKPRDHSRLLVLNKENGKIEHKYFYNLDKYFKKGDILVLNNTKVFPARLIGKKESGAKMEIFLHKFKEKNIWQCLVGGKKAQNNLLIIFNKKLNCRLLKNNKDGTWNVEFNMSYKDLMKEVKKIGKTPLPPYIKRKEDNELSKKDKVNYQTIYAHRKKVGSVAAPTAGLHFTPELMKTLRKKGVQFEYITLHVGLGTFAPVKTENIKEHQMHEEYVEISKKTINNIYQAKKKGKRIIAVGTTSVRSLESAFQSFKKTKLKTFPEFKTWTNIFIYPGYKFNIVDAIITNFHLPKSTLLMLVQAFAGKNNINQAYQKAIQKKYRFFSYGDAMFIY